MERYCQSCGKKLTTEEYNFCFNCQSKQIQDDRIWDISSNKSNLVKDKELAKKVIICNKIENLLNEITKNDNIFWQCWYDIEKETINVSKYNNKISDETEKFHKYKIVKYDSLNGFLIDLFKLLEEIILEI